MNVSSRCIYAYLAVLELATLSTPQALLRAETIATRRGIPEKFLEQILTQLKRAGIVNSLRGAKGGYRLAKPASQISLLDIVVAAEGPLFESIPPEASEGDDCWAVWHKAAESIRQELAKIRIQGVVDDHIQRKMYYI